jgi:phosphoenolpyruvate carboxylase
MKSSKDKEKAIDEIVKIIQDFQDNDELSEKYKREILVQDKIYD